MLRRVDLHSQLTFGNSFLFPLQSAQARREVVIGGLFLLVPIVGWLLNMGHRVMMVHRMQHGQEPWPAWQSHRALLRHGTMTFLGMVYYYSPAAACGLIGRFRHLPILYPVAALLFAVATMALPGYMSHYCREFDPREIFNPFRALTRAFQGGVCYWKAWSIALAGLVLSFTGLLVLGLGFLFTSVWFWQVAGFSFATVFTRCFDLNDDGHRPHQTRPG